jgi:hypothetical protein
VRKLTTAGLVLSALFAASGQPSQAASVVHQSASTCTGIKAVCLLGKDCGYGFAPCGGQGFCNYAWEHCMNTGFWEGRFLHRAAERR